jgi:putative tryptophan/tyrosine transport system substrate-binding protein
MRRREFISLIGGAAAAWPLAARAQQSDRIRRIGVLMAYAEDNPDGKPRLAAFAKALQELGWTDGRNIRIEYRWSAGDAERTRRYATELVALSPDIILAGNTSTVGPLQQATHTVPIVFAGVVDPVGAGFVNSLAHPGGNITGFTQFEYGMSGKWLELLKEVAPNVTRADRVDPFRRAAAYVDRILKGEKPADLPVQAPTKYELVINLKTAKTMGLSIPPSLLARADDVIE